MRKILVIGDIIDDVYRHGKYMSMSAEPENAVRVIREISRTETPGGVANVLTHAESLGASSDIIWFRDVPSTTKERIFVDGKKICQIDILQNASWDIEKLTKFSNELRPSISEFDVLYVSDNGHGFWTDESVNVLARELRYAKKRPLVYVDSQMSQNLPNYDVLAPLIPDLVLMNEHEHQKALDMTGDVPLLEFLGNEDANLVLKYGDKGALLFSSEIIVLCSAKKVDVVDTCGAGDALGAYLAPHDFENDMENVLQGAFDYAT